MADMRFTRTSRRLSPRSTSSGTRVERERQRERPRRLAEIKVELDRYWDLLRRRRSAADAGGNPDEVEIRNEGTVEDICSRRFQPSTQTLRIVYNARTAKMASAPEAAEASPAPPRRGGRGAAPCRARTCRPRGSCSWRAACGASQREVGSAGRRRADHDLPALARQGRLSLSVVLDVVEQVVNARAGIRARSCSHS